MADFAPNYTARYRLHYSSLGKAHSMLWRIERGTGSTGLAVMIAKVEDFLNTLTAARYTDWEVLSAEYAPEDVDIFAPASVPAPDTGTVAIPTDPVSQSCLSTGFVGRSDVGQKARMFIWGCNFNPEAGSAAVADDFRVHSSEHAIIAAAILELNSGGPPIQASDNHNVSWYTYVNVKYNDHWVARSRS